MLACTATTDPKLSYASSIFRDSKSTDLRQKQIVLCLQSKINLSRHEEVLLGYIGKISPSRALHYGNHSSVMGLFPA